MSASSKSCDAYRLVSRSWLRTIGILLVLAGFVIASTPVGAQGEDETIVYAVPIEGTIDLGLAPFLDRVLDEAEDDPAVEAVILEINTPGGRLDAVLQMRDALLDAEVRTIAFVNREAFSAGALIAIACQEIYMAPGAVMGAATPVTGSGETASEKVISAVRKTFKSTAEQRGRNPAVAEAMVDPDVAIEGLVDSGELLTLTTEEAVEWGYADGVVANRGELLTATGLTEATIVEKSPSLAERLVRFLTNPVVASLLFSLGLLLILGDVLIGGVGLIALVGVGMLGLFFWGHFLAGLAGWEGLALVGLGLILIGVEAFVIPGFGVAGILGLVSLLAGFYLTLVGGAIRTDEDTWRAVTGTGIALVVLLAGAILLLFLLPQMSRFGGMTLQTRVGREEEQPVGGGFLGWFRRTPLTEEEAQEAQSRGPTNPVERRGALLGATGRALSDLRPGGIATIEGERVDVVSEGGYIVAGTEIVVTRDDGYRRVVREIETETRHNDELD